MFENRFVYRAAALMLRSLVAAIAVTALAQGQIVQLTNLTNVGNSEFAVGDRYEMVITGAANQPISVRTTSNGRTDWSPIIGQTNANGRWSTSGAYGKEDYGDWNVVWTISGKLASPILQFSVGAPCLTKGRSGMIHTGRMRIETCDTVEGLQSFGTPSDNEPFRTPDGRIIPGHSRSTLTREQYNIDILQSLIFGPIADMRPRWVDRFGDEAAILIMKMMRENALTEEEVRHILVIMREAFERPDHLEPAIRNPVATLPFLLALANATDQDDLKQQISDTIDHLRTQLSAAR